MYNMKKKQINNQFVIYAPECQFFVNIFGYLVGPVGALQW